MAQVVIKAGKEKKLRNLYPWVYREEIENVEGEAKAGDLVELQDARGEFIARAFYNPASHIPARIVTFDPREKVGIEFFRTRIAGAQRRREEAVGNTNAYRVVHAEADGLPGLIVDRLGEVLVVQIRNAGIRCVLRLKNWPPIRHEHKSTRVQVIGLTVRQPAICLLISGVE